MALCNTRYILNSKYGVRNLDHMACCIDKVCTPLMLGYVGNFFEDSTKNLWILTIIMGILH